MSDQRARTPLRDVRGRDRTHKKPASGLNVRAGWAGTERIKNLQLGGSVWPGGGSELRGLTFRGRPNFLATPPLRISFPIAVALFPSIWAISLYPLPFARRACATALSAAFINFPRPILHGKSEKVWRIGRNEKEEGC